MEKPQKQRTIVFPDGSTAKVHPELSEPVGPKPEAKPTPWQGLKAALIRWLISLLP